MRREPNLDDRISSWWNDPTRARAGSVFLTAEYENKYEWRKERRKETHTANAENTPKAELHRQRNETRHARNKKAAKKLAGNRATDTGRIPSDKETQATDTGRIPSDHNRRNPVKTRVQQKHRHFFRTFVSPVFFRLPRCLLSFAGKYMNLAMLIMYIYLHIFVYEREGVCVC